MKNIIGYKNYVINEYGEVYNKKTFNKLSIHKDKKGYCYVWLWENNIGKRHSIHRLVSIHFIDNKLNKPCVNHKDGIKSNNCVNNLEWVTYSENNKHSYATGLKKSSNIQKEAASNANSKVVLNLQNGVFYKSAKEASLVSNIKYSSLRGMLNGNDKNQTSFVYV